MHLDSYLTIYRQQERELEQRLLQRFAAAERAPGGPTRARGHRMTHIRLHRKGAARL